MHRISICFLLIITAFITPSNAQFSKGMHMAGATIGTAFFNSGDIKYSAPAPTLGYNAKTNAVGLSLSPSYGWFISDKTVIGVQLSFGYRYDKLLNTDQGGVTYYKNINKTVTAGLGGFVRNYFSASGSFLPFVQASIGGGIASSSRDGFYYNNAPLYKDVFEGKSSGDFTFNGGISIGATKMLNQHVGLDIIAGYNYSHNKNEYETNTRRDVDINGSIDETEVNNLTTTSGNHGFTLGAGLQIFLGKGK